jgi:hypothetical protein
MYQNGSPLVEKVVDDASLGSLPEVVVNDLLNFPEIVIAGGP